MRGNKMACNKIYDEKGRVAAIACGNQSKEWEEMVRELEERTRVKEKGNDNE